MKLLSSPTFWRWRHRAQLVYAASAALISWAVLLWVAARLPELSTWLVALGVNDLLAVAGLLTALFLALAPHGMSLLDRWARSGWGATDSILVVGSLVGVTVLVYQQLASSRLTGLAGIAGIVAGLVAILGLRGMAIMQRSFRTSRRRENAPLLSDKILDPQGLAPLQSEHEDELERGKLVDELVALLAQPRETSVNFGLEGAWGSGKTSLLNFVQDRLRSRGFIIVRLDLWSYREPERLVRVYFEQLATAMESQAPHIQTRRQLRRLAAGLVELGGSRLAQATHRVLGDLGTEPLESIRSNLQDAMKTFEKPILVFLDDLDRLDRNELLAVLRSVRLMSELPNLTQVLAYDREQLSLTLFPEDPAGTRARDHIGKIVNREFTIGTPPRELAGRLLEQSLQRFLDTIADPGAADLFRERIQQRPKLITDALPTPREIRRIAAATAGRWQQMAGHLNPFDLLVLTIIQYRFPAIYHSIRAHPEWFVELSWSHDLYIRLVESERDRLRQRGEEFLTEVGEGRSSESGVAAQLLGALFPNLRDASGLTETDARRQRRIMHPRIIDRYFHLYVPRNTVAEQEIETYAVRLNTVAGEQRQKLLSQIIALEKERGRLDSFLDQWDLVYGQHPEMNRHDPDLVRDLALGLAQSTEHYSEESSFYRTSQLTFVAYKVLFLSFHLTTIENATQLLVDVIHCASRLSFGGTIVQYASRDKRPSTYQDVPEADSSALKEALASRVLDLVASQQSNLLKLPASDRAAALFATGNDRRVRELMFRALASDPRLLPRLLEHGAARRTYPSGEVVVAESFDADTLAERVDLQRVQRLTGHLPLDTWTEPSDRELVSRFRDWIRVESDGVADDG